MHIYIQLATATCNIIGYYIDKRNTFQIFWNYRMFHVPWRKHNNTCFILTATLAAKAILHFHRIIKVWQVLVSFDPFFIHTTNKLATIAIGELPSYGILKILEKAIRVLVISNVFKKTTCSNQSSVPGYCDYNSPPLHTSVVIDWLVAFPIQWDGHYSPLLNPKQIVKV